MSETRGSDERYPSGRRREPIGVRTGGAAWNRVHELLALTALRLMAQRGYDDMTMDDVAHHSGVSKRTLYRHFSTKVELGEAAIQRLPTWEGFNLGTGSFRERVRTFIELAGSFEEAFTPVLATVLVNRTTVPELLAALREHVLVPRERVFEQILHEGQVAGELRDDIQPSALASLSLGIQVDHLTGMHKWENDDAGIDYAMNTIWPLIRSQ